MNFSFQSYFSKQIIMQAFRAWTSFGPIPSDLGGGGHFDNTVHSIWHMGGTDHLPKGREQMDGIAQGHGTGAGTPSYIFLPPGLAGVNCVLK